MGEVVAESGPLTVHRDLPGAVEAQVGLGEMVVGHQVVGWDQVVQAICSIPLDFDVIGGNVVDVIAEDLVAVPSFKLDTVGT